MINKALAMNDFLYESILSVSLAEPEVLQRLLWEVPGHEISVMLSAPEVGQ